MADHAEVAKKVAQAFLAEDYSTCVDLVASVLPSTNVFNLQAMLISLHRLDRIEVVSQWEKEFYGRLEAFPWEHRLIGLTLGKVPLQDVFQAARNEEQRCEAHYYAAQIHITEGRFEAAIKEFKTCLHHNQNSPERWLAGLTLRVLKDHRALIEGHFKVRSLLNESERYKRKGMIEAASKSAANAYGIALQELADCDPLFQRALVSARSAQHGKGG